MIRCAVLLAAGRGTRMGALTADRPKPLLEVAGRPLLEHIIAGLVQCGVERVVIVIGYLGEQIEQRLGGGHRVGCRVDYCWQRQTDGTARALLQAAPMIGAEPFILSWGDILVYPRFYGELVAAFTARPCEVLLAVNAVEDPWRGAAVYVDDDWRVIRVEEKPRRGRSTTRWNNAGIHVLTAAILPYARRLRRSTRGEFELPDAITHMIEAGLPVRAEPVRGFWSDVGTPADLERANDVLRGEV